MRYYLDTEFYEDGKTIDLISLALVCEDGRELYLVNQEAQLHLVSDWVRANVLPQLPPYGDKRWVTRTNIREQIVSFITGRPDPEFWAYYADYDWVVFCQLFGTMIDLPSYMPKFCRDLKQLAMDKGNPRLPKQDGGEHDALADARWNMRIHSFLETIPTLGVPRNGGG